MYRIVIATILFAVLPRFPGKGETPGAYDPGMVGRDEVWHLLSLGTTIGDPGN